MININQKDWKLAWKIILKQSYKIWSVCVCWQYFPFHSSMITKSIWLIWKKFAKKYAKEFDFFVLFWMNSFYCYGKIWPSIIIENNIIFVLFMNFNNKYSHLLRIHTCWQVYMLFYLTYNDYYWPSSLSNIFFNSSVCQAIIILIMHLLLFYFICSNNQCSSFVLFIQSKYDECHGLITIIIIIIYEWMIEDLKMSIHKHYLIISIMMSTVTAFLLNNPIAISTNN